MLLCLSLFMCVVYVLLRLFDFVCDLCFVFCSMFYYIKCDCCGCSWVCLRCCFWLLFMCMGMFTFMVMCMPSCMLLFKFVFRIVVLISLMIACLILCLFMCLFMMLFLFLCFLMVWDVCPLCTFLFILY